MPPPPSNKAADYEKALQEVKDYILTGQMPIHSMMPGAVFAVNPQDPEE